jgi:putative NIF3 family GTP cyclohydrolase 1 type 2
VTAKEIIEKIKSQPEFRWNNFLLDGWQTGNPDTPVSGIVTSFTPSVNVLKQAVVGKKNMIITQQPAYYLQTETYLQSDPTFNYKKDFIKKNRLFLYQLKDNPKSGWADKFPGLANALGWDAFLLRNDFYTEQVDSNGTQYFNLPESRVWEKVKDIEASLQIKGLRVIGNRQTKIKKTSLTTGMFRLSALQKILKEPDIDLIVVAEAIEWESCEYFRDYLTWKGDQKAMILLGREATEDPACKALASWLATFITEVPVEWITAGEPFWVP